MALDLDLDLEPVREVSTRRLLLFLRAIVQYRQAPDGTKDAEPAAERRDRPVPDDRRDPVRRTNFKLGGPARAPFCRRSSHSMRCPGGVIAVVRSQFAALSAWAPVGPTHSFERQVLESPEPLCTNSRRIE
jgi:hypothetical protein